MAGNRHCYSLSEGQLTIWCWNLKPDWSASLLLEYYAQKIHTCSDGYTCINEVNCWSNFKKV